MWHPLYLYSAKDKDVFPSHTSKKEKTLDKADQLPWVIQLPLNDTLFKIGLETHFATLPTFLEVWSVHTSISGLTPMFLFLDVPIDFKHLRVFCCLFFSWWRCWYNKKWAVWVTILCYTHRKWLFFWEWSAKTWMSIFANVVSSSHFNIWQRGSMTATKKEV